MVCAIDLFCGAGGMCEGLFQAGFDVLFSNDISSDAGLTYKNRHQQLGRVSGIDYYFHHGDIAQLNKEFIWNKINNLKKFSQQEPPVEIDAIFGGPPCQGFSRSGKRDPNDPRNRLFLEYIRIIDEMQPKYVVMENVEGFLDTYFCDFIGLYNKKYIGENLVSEILISEFASAGYSVIEPKILNAADYGVPQNRKRVIFLAYRKDVIAPKYPPAHKGPKKTVADALSTKNETNYQKKLSSGCTPDINNNTVPAFGKLNNHNFSLHNETVTERFSLYLQGENSIALKRRIIRDGILISKYPMLLELLEKKTNYSRRQLMYIFRTGKVTQEIFDILLTKKNKRIRLLENQPSPTVLTLPDDFLSHEENRILTVREMARLQSFDDSFVFYGKRTTGGERRRLETPQYTQVGNAVPPFLAKAIAKEIVVALSRTKTLSTNACKKERPFQKLCKPRG